jgi:hypothetical protein
VSEHSKYSPSSSDRWLACPGSLTIGSESDSANQYTAEGSVAHEIAYQCLEFGLLPDSFLGKTIVQDGFEIEVTEEMVVSIQIYLDAVERMADGEEIVLEQRIEHSVWAEFGGTLDCLVPTRNLVIDFKYGAGVAVEVDGNTQLQCYALLYLDKYNNGYIEDVTVVIVQPRANHPDGPVRQWIATSHRLYILKEQLGETIGVINETFHAGDWCRWCPHKAQCPELYELTLKTAQQEFKPAGMTAEKAAEILETSEAVTKYLEAVKQWVHGQLDKGLPVPGYKLVNTYTNRQYCFDEPTIEKRCKAKGFGKKQIYTTELLSPAQLEKVVGKELISSLTERKLRGTTVVPESDRREAVERLTAADEFAGVS